MGKELALAILGVSASLILTGCGGGGSSPVKTSFSSFINIPPNSTADVTGEAIEESYTLGSAPPFPVTSVTDLGTDSTATASLSFDSDGQLSKLSITTDNGVVSWNSSTDFFVPSQGIIQMISADGDRYAYAIDPLDFGWDYQTFGTWISGLNSLSPRSGSITVGARTNGDSVPSTGTATFIGAVGGTYIDSAGAGFLVIGNSSIGADFDARSLTFETTNNNTINLVDASPGTNSNLNLSGTLTYSAGSNNFTGTVNGTGLTGSASGYFYGPAAEEAGGTFSLSGSGVERYTGAFGASQ
jgi:hypothetical protein